MRRLSSPRNRCCPVHRDHAILLAVALDDGDRPRLDDEEVAPALSCSEEHLPGFYRSDASEFAEASPLLFAQARKGSVPLGRLRLPRTRGVAGPGHPPSGDGGIVVSPRTWGIRRATSSA